MSNMANILKNVIKNGGMPLTQVSERIETMYLSGRISGEERNELTELMHSNANPSNEAGDYKALYKALTERYNELEARVIALEQSNGVSGGNDGEADGSTEGYPAWKPWDGVSAGYQAGDIVTHGGKNWRNVLIGMGNVWEPGAPGVDERYWKEVVA